MTLITFVLTDEYVVLASDRRITLARGTKVISQDDKAVKSVLLNGQLLLGFTPAAWPMGFRVSNTANVVRGARMEFSHPSTDFASTRFVLGNQRQMVGAVGYPYSNTALRSLEGSVRLALRLDASDPSKVFRPVIGFMRGGRAAKRWICRGLNRYYRNPTV